VGSCALRLCRMPISAPRHRLLLAAALVALFAVATPTARADGDPASDVLLFQKVYASYFAKLPPASTAELKRVVKEANARGFKIRVALIGNRYDLGSVTPLWQKPQAYAKFLGQELAVTGLYRDRVLTVMPNGYGVSRNGQAVPSEQKLLDALPTPLAKGQDVATAALTAVQELAAGQGVKLAVTIPDTAAGGKGSGTSDRLKILAVALTLLAIGLALEAVRRIRRSRADPGADEPGSPVGS
jgi:hypothetical protein